MRLQTLAEDSDAISNDSFAHVPIQPPTEDSDAISNESFTNIPSQAAMQVPAEDSSDDSSYDSFSPLMGLAVLSNN